MADFIIIAQVGVYVFVVLIFIVVSVSFRKAHKTFNPKNDEKEEIDIIKNTTFSRTNHPDHTKVTRSINDSFQYCPSCNTKIYFKKGRLCPVCHTHYICPKCRRCTNKEQHRGI